jgi:hypothetical protein
LQWYNNNFFPWLQEFLMAGCWLLLKNPTNRQVLGNAFSTNPGSTKLAQGMMQKLQATVDVADVNEAVSNRRPDRQP